MMTRYGTLRSWAQLLKFLGVLLVIAALFGTIATAIEVEGFWKTLGVIFIGIPVAVFLATLPIALGQLMTAVADVGDTVNPP
jgi:hypothetical protein